MIITGTRIRGIFTNISLLVPRNIQKLNFSSIYTWYIVQYILTAIWNVVYTCMQEIFVPVSFFRPLHPHCQRAHLKQRDFLNRTQPWWANFGWGWNSLKVQKSERKKKQIKNTRAKKKLYSVHIYCLSLNGYVSLCFYFAKRLVFLSSDLIRQNYQICGNEWLTISGKNKNHPKCKH